MSKLKNNHISELMAMSEYDEDIKLQVNSEIHLSKEYENLVKLEKFENDAMQEANEFLVFSNEKIDQNEMKIIAEEIGF